MKSGSSKKHGAQGRELRSLQRLVMQRTERPMFIPLKREFYRDFELGVKCVEYRRKGKVWNAKTCRVGRDVVLSLGYGTQNRMTGVIVGYWEDNTPLNLPGWATCYGDAPGDVAACIMVKLHNEVAHSRPEGGAR